MEVRLYAWQLFRGLLFLHAKNIVHRDIKPANILVDPKEYKSCICDFGSAKHFDPADEAKKSVSYICSRYYRAPELIFGNT